MLNDVCMKYLLTILMIIIPAQATADPICPVNEAIEEDMRIPESYFNQDNAEDALARLEAIIRDGARTKNWTEIPNALKIIEGFILRRNAMEATGSLIDYHESQFCSFMSESAWWFD